MKDFEAMPQGFTLRVARADDGAPAREVVFSVLEEFGLRPDPKGTDRDLTDLAGHYLEAGGWFGIVEDAGGRTVGTVGLAQTGEEGVVELRKMYLRREARGQGVGRAVLRAVIAQAVRMGYRRMTLETASVLRDAVRLYERHGFARLPDAPHACRCDLAMSRELP